MLAPKERNPQKYTQKLLHMTRNQRIKRKLLLPKERNPKAIIYTQDPHKCKRCYNFNAVFEKIPKQQQPIKGGSSTIKTSKQS